MLIRIYIYIYDQQSGVASVKSQVKKQGDKTKPLPVSCWCWHLAWVGLGRAGAGSTSWQNGSKEPCGVPGGEAAV